MCARYRDVRMLMARLSPRGPPWGAVDPRGIPWGLESGPRPSTLAAKGSACRAAAGRLLCPGALRAVTGAAHSPGSLQGSGQLGTHFKKVHRCKISRQNNDPHLACPVQAAKKLGSLTAHAACS